MNNATLNLAGNAIANTTPAPNATDAALALVRDDNVTLAELARYFGQSETWAAGLVHVVIGDDDFAFAASMDGYDPSPAEMADDQAGLRFGFDLTEREALADGWSECYAIAAVEAAMAAEPLPPPPDDCPW